MNTVDLVVAPITKVETKGLVNLENNYLRLGKTEGGKYSLVEVRRELARREGGKFDGQTVFERIMTLASQSQDNLITYGQLYESLHQIKWVGNGSQQKVNKDLGAVFYYCVQNELPIVTTLVVPGGNRTLTELAKQNIYDCAKRLGVKDMQASADLFVTEQQAQSLALVNA